MPTKSSARCGWSTLLGLRTNPAVRSLQATVRMALRRCSFGRPRPARRPVTPASPPQGRLHQPIDQLLANGRAVLPAEGLPCDPVRVPPHLHHKQAPPGPWHPGRPVAVGQVALRLVGGPPAGHPEPEPLRAREVEPRGPPLVPPVHLLQVEQQPALLSSVFGRRDAVSVAGRLVCLTPRVVTLMSSVMQLSTSAFRPLPLASAPARLRWRLYFESRSRGTSLSQMASAMVTDPAPPRPRRAVSSPTSESSSEEDSYPSS